MTYPYDDTYDELYDPQEADREARLVAIESQLAEREQEAAVDTLIAYAEQGDPEAIDALAQLGYDISDLEDDDGGYDEEEAVLEAAAEMAAEIEQARGHALTQSELADVLRDTVEGREGGSGAVQKMVSHDLSDAEQRREYMASRVAEGQQDEADQQADTDYVRADIEAGLDNEGEYE